MVKVKEDLTNQIFGRLTVLNQVDDYVDSNGQHLAQWLCQCNCKDSNYIIVIGKSLKSGNTKSCGCFHKEKVVASGKKNKKNNRYELNLKDEHGLYGIGHCTNTGREFYFDMDDYDRISKYTWLEASDHSDYHFVRSSGSGDKTYTPMHSVITGEKYCDHIDRNSFNNRKFNLRNATYAENARNRTISKKNNSGFIGVFWANRDDKWCAQITFNKSKKHLGYFINKVDAIKARLQAEAKYFGEFAPQRHLFKEYGITMGG